MKLRVYFVMLSINLVLIGCALQAAPTPTATPTTISTPTLEVTSFTPTSPPVATATPRPTATRIEFTRGATAASLEQQPIPANTTLTYLIHAQAGQKAGISLAPFSTNDTVFLALQGADNRTLLTAAEQQRFWNGALPTTQDYIVQVINTGAATSYALHITIPSRIAFAPGADSATVQGYIATVNGNSYELQARQDQTLTLALLEPPSGAFLTLTGADGTPLLRSALRQTQWSGTLPATQDYTLGVLAESVGIRYTLVVTITN